MFALTLGRDVFLPRASRFVPSEIPNEMGSCGLVIDGGYGEINNNSNKSRSSLPVLDGGLPSGGSCG